MSQGTDRVRDAQDRLDSTSPASVRLDPGQVAELYRLHANDLQAFLVGLLRDRDLAGEVLQVTFAKVLEVGAEEIQDLKGWLFRVGFREAMNVRRRQQIDQRCLKKVAWNLETAAGTEYQTGMTGEVAGQSSLAGLGRDDRPEERLVKREEIERVRQVLTMLPVEQQQVVQMRMYEDKTFQSIADELGLPLGTVLSRMRLALHKLELKLK